MISKVGIKYDAIVIGAGPAGASAARTLVAGGMKTLIIEKKILPREKPCGGILTKDSFVFTQNKFGQIPASAFSNPPFLKGIAAWHALRPAPIILSLVEPTAVVWRSKFDAFLAEASGAEINDGLQPGLIEQDSNLFTIACSHKGINRPELFHTRYLIAADGHISQTVRQIMPNAYDNLPGVAVMQVHYRGKINVDPKHYNFFFGKGIGTYSWANIKDDTILVGLGNFDYHNTLIYFNNFIDLLKRQYGLTIESTLKKEGICGKMMAPLNTFVLGKGNLLVAGDAGGFFHTLGEGISAALYTGDIAGKAILTAEKTNQKAIDVYKDVVRDEVYKCIHQHNPLYMLKSVPFALDLRTTWQNHSLSNIYKMCKSVLPENLTVWKNIGVYDISKYNMIYRLIHGHYPDMKHIGDNFIIGKAGPQ